jgi:hypothetical protein
MENKLSKKQIDLDSLIEQIESIIDDLKSYTILDQESVNDFEEAKRENDIAWLQDIKSNLEYDLEEFWDSVSNDNDIVVGYPNALGGY